MKKSPGMAHLKKHVYENHSVTPIAQNKYLLTLRSNFSTRHSNDDSTSLASRSQTRHNGKFSSGRGLRTLRVFGVVFAGAGIQWAKHRSWYPEIVPENFCRTVRAGAEWIERCFMGWGWKDHFEQCYQVTRLFFKIWPFSTWIIFLITLKFCQSRFKTKSQILN